MKATIQNETGVFFINGFAPCKEKRKIALFARLFSLKHVERNDLNSGSLHHFLNPASQILNSLETTIAILLRKTKLSDTSLIITWFTEDHGKLKTVAKGARRPKSSFAGKLDLFFEAEISFVRSKKSDLHTLREVMLQNPREGLRKGYRQVQLASYFVELVELVTESDHAAPELYDLLKRGLDYLETHPPTKRAMLHFESELTRLLGIHDKKETSPAQAIGRIHGRLPSTRQELIAKLT